MDNYHLKYTGKNWSLEKAKAERASKVFDGTKQEAIKQTAKFMQNHPGSVKIHKLDGRIQEERTYPGSKDPKQSKG